MKSRVCYQGRADVDGKAGGGVREPDETAAGSISRAGLLSLRAETGEDERRRPPRLLHAAL